MEEWKKEVLSEISASSYAFVNSICAIADANGLDRNETIKRSICYIAQVSEDYNYDNFKVISPDEVETDEANS